MVYGGPSPARYAQLMKIVEEVKAATLVEVGVARAFRARDMSMAALKHRPDVAYIGYDVFETKDENFHRAAFNHKRVQTEANCRAYLQKIVNEHQHYVFDLVVGDTRETLHGKHVLADVAFIDGDHRLECIRGDYLALKDSGVVVFDDYFEPDERGIPDIDKYGCNRVIEEIRAKGDRTIEILPIADSGKMQGRSKLVAVRRE